MRHRAIRISVLVFLGAIVNVAVAWGCTLLAERKASLAPPELTSMSDVQNLRGNGFVVNGNGVAIGDGIESIERSAFGRRETVSYQPAKGTSGLSTLGDVFAVEIRNGWPCYALAGFSAPVSAPADDLWRTRQVNAWRSQSTRVQTWWQDVVPLSPLWPGFAINTLFYATILWLLFAGPFVLRKRLRIRRGRCPKCAYDLRGSTNTNACPECGAAVMAKWGRRLCLPRLVGEV